MVYVEYIFKVMILMANIIFMHDFASIIHHLFYVYIKYNISYICKYKKCYISYVYIYLYIYYICIVRITHIIKIKTIP